jgi:hypothetical protein
MLIKVRKSSLSFIGSLETHRIKKREELWGQIHLCPNLETQSLKRSISITENDRFGLGFAKTGSIDSGTVQCWKTIVNEQWLKYQVNPDIAELIAQYFITTWTTGVELRFFRWLLLF